MGLLPNGRGGEKCFGYPDERVIGMVSVSNRRLIVAYWRQYFFIEYRNLPPETIGVPSPGESHCTVWNSQKSNGGPPAAAACWADLCRVVSDS